jgi:signal transduction histidine kinase
VVDLLDLSRLDSCGAAPTMQPVRLDDVAARVVEELAPSAERKGRVLSLSKASALVMGDEAQLERALINLVDNAIKYSGTGGRIEVAVAEEGAYATVRVTDDGPGIAPSDQPRIFERFYRVDRSRAREMGGTGLGLSIVKHIAQAHGGSVELSSALGSGSTFTLRLPRGGVPRD